MTPAADTDTPQSATADAEARGLSRLVGALAEDAMFALAGSRDGGLTTLGPLGRRRADAYAACVAGADLPGMIDGFDAWLITLSRAMAPLTPPVWLPMAEVVEEGVTLEAGARGLRALFSNKPSERDVQRVRRLGTLAVRVLRAVLAADGNVDSEEARTLAALVASLGLADADGAPLLTEAPLSVEQLDIYGDVAPAVARALLRGAWLAAAWDTLDPREEQVVRRLASKLSVGPEEVEAARADAIARVDARRLTGLAVVDFVRFLLSDRFPGVGVLLAVKAGTLMLPRRHREEVLAQIAHGSPVLLARRHMNLSEEDRSVALGVAWAAALHDDPSIARLAVLRARYDRVAEDLADDGVRPREAVSEWVREVLAGLVGPIGREP